MPVGVNCCCSASGGKHNSMKRRARQKLNVTVLWLMWRQDADLIFLGDGTQSVGVRALSSHGGYSKPVVRSLQNMSGVIPVSPCHNGRELQHIICYFALSDHEEMLAGISALLQM